MDLKQTLDNKMTLRFKNGRFRILTVSDLHGVCNFDRRVVRDLNAICDGVKPDLVLFLGDIVWRDAAENADALYAYLREVTAYLEENRIPWAHVFGNHDTERGYPVDRQQEVYERFPCCLAKRGPADVAGTGNYILPVYASDGEKIVYAVWGLDSHRDMHEYLLEAGFPDDYRLVMMPDPMHLSQSYDAIRFNQIRWYRDTAKALTAQNGEKVPGLMVFHIPLPEFLKSLPGPVAVFAATDVRASEVLQAAKIAKLAVPARLAVIGVDDNKLICENAVPRLSSVRPDFEQEGYLAAQALSKMMLAADRSQLTAELKSPTTIPVGVLGVVTRDSSAVVASANQLVRRALAYIKAHAADGISVDDVVRHTKVSRRLLYLRFAEETDLTIRGAIEAERLEAVTRLLKTTRLTTEEIAARCGFGNPNVLRNLFRRRYGTSMTAFRK